MEMCYDGALVMPSGCALMDEEEMTYLEGGVKKLIGYFSSTDCNRMAAIACIAGGLITAVCGVATIVSGVATVLSLGTTAAAFAICAGITCVAGGATAAISGYLWLASTYNGLNVYGDTKTKLVSVKIRK